jgi:hypothetical protein
MSDEITTNRIGGIAFTQKDDDEDAQIEFMARRLGYNRYVFIGYHYENCLLWANSRGNAGDGRIRIATKCVDTIGALGIALILRENDELRRDVFSILNQEADYMATKAKVDGQGNKDRD